MKYSEIIGVGKHFKSAFDVVSDRGEAWKAFISNERFERNLSQIITSFTSPSLDKRKSIWIQGTYGTGKSHSLSVIKHLLSDDFETIADYIPKLKRSQLRGSITSFRKNKRVFPVVLKGVHAITDVADLTYTIQHQVAKALNDKAIQISTKTDFDSLLQIMQNESLDSFFSGIIEKNVELRSYAANKSQLIRALKNYDIGVLRLVSDEMKAAGLGSFRTHNIVDWLTEVRRELKRQGIADYLLIIWDEFTNLLEIPARRSILNVMQDIAELSYSESEDDPSDTLGVYLILVTHKRLEATETYKELKEDERNMAQARFTELDYGMQPTTTFHNLLPLGSYIMYVGRAEKTETHNLKVRAKSHYNNYRRHEENERLERVFDHWKPYVYISYLPIDKNDVIDLVEQQLIMALTPPCNKMYPSPRVRRKLSAFQYS